MGGARTREVFFMILKNSSSLTSPSPARGSPWQRGQQSAHEAAQNPRSHAGSRPGGWLAARSSEGGHTASLPAQADGRVCVRAPAARTAARTVAVSLVDHLLELLIGHVLAELLGHALQVLEGDLPLRDGREGRSARVRGARRRAIAADALAESRARSAELDGAAPLSQGRFDCQ